MILPLWRAILLTGGAWSILAPQASAADVAFTTYAFPATGTPTSRTLPARLAEIKDVRDFGAKGDGVTDDWAAIMAAFNAVVGSNRGTIYFPPGTYLVSQSIAFNTTLNNGVTSLWQGELGLSVITGNFNDFVMSRAGNGNDGALNIVIENLTIINTHATGGGIRFGDLDGGAIRNCVVTANRAITTLGDDSLPGFGSFECSFENLALSPGANVSGSYGLANTANGVVANCRIIGFETGIQAFAGEGSMQYAGCYFEGNGVGFLPGIAPSGIHLGVGQIVVSGCRFKNNSVAIKFLTGGSATYCGLRIEGTNGQAPGGTNPQYGIQCGNPGSGTIAHNALFAGISVTGQYDIAGIYINGGEFFQQQNTFMGVTSVNSGSGVAWDFPLSVATSAKFFACNVAPIYTMAQLGARIWSSSSASWVANSVWTFTSLPSSDTPSGSGYVPGDYHNVPLTGGSGTGAVASSVTVNGGGEVVAVSFYPSGTNYVVGDALSASNANLGGSGSGFSLTVATVRDTATIATAGVPGAFNTLKANILVSGISPSGYNGLFLGAVFTSGSTITYPISNPGGAGGAGSVVVNPIDPNGSVPQESVVVQEGECFDVSDANTAVWGANPIGGGSSHAKVRWGSNGTNWTVVGK